MTRDMTEGNITKHLLFYAVPLVFGNLFQQLYHTVDSVVVGQFHGKKALAAVGAAGPIMNILTFLIVGISMGTSILMARYFGARQEEELRKELGTSLTAGFLLTLVLAVVSFLGSAWFIRITNTPDEIAAPAATYLRIICTGLLFTFLYNLFSAALRAIGDSRAPLLVLILTTIVNVILDIVLVGILRLGVTGAALATILSQAVSGLSLLLYIRLRVPLLCLTLKDLRLNREMLRLTADFSSISAVQQTALYVGRLLVQAGVNALGVDAVAAFNAVSIIDSYVLAR
ncbi:MAG: MATE family efflux transporter [Otoolea sp.]